MEVFQAGSPFVFPLQRSLAPNAQELNACATKGRACLHASKLSKTDMTDFEDIVPLIRFLMSDGWWMTGQTILVSGGYTTR